MHIAELEQLVRGAPPGTRLEFVHITVHTPVAEEPVEDTVVRNAWGPLQIVEWVRSEHGEPGIKLKEWAAMLPGVSHRELLRAADDGRLDWHPKPDGRDHGARMASPDAMLAFLAAAGHVLPETPGE
ncbi:MAG TPA: hypothetical protein VGC13_31415 [Longimicrobium sp.]|jgi:hypothetical protein|uniref:hypothetical protein n=1 Tax=Longimicrobium sp. TaxID=2029185 RepID=UPI002EDBA13E